MKKQIEKFLKIVQTPYKVITENFIFFSQRTALHGVKYIGNRALSPFDRIYFFMSFFLILTFAIIMSSNIYAKWLRTPVIVGYNGRPTRIFDFPFPSITICNANQLSLNSVQNVTKNSFEYYMVQTLCSRSFDNKHDLSEQELVKNRTMFQRFLSENAQPCEKLFILCRFGRQLKNCMDIFTTVITDEGVCCVFNAMHLSFIYKNPGVVSHIIQPDGTIGVNWHPEDGYQQALPKHFYPRLAIGTGISLGLTIIINAEAEDYYCSSTNGVGFKLLLHNPIEIPTLRDNGLLVRTGSEITFRIAVDRAESTDNLRSFSVKDRQCVFKSERKLAFFKTYTQNNCELECLSNITQKLCGCTSYFLPETWTNAPACGFTDMECIDPILNWSPEASSAKKQQKYCRDFCMQGCFDLTYSAVRFTIPLSGGEYMMNEEILEGFNASYRLRNIAVIHFYYKNSHFIGSLRNRYIGATEFMSSVGGFIGLLGFSYISLSELVYFVFIRSLSPLASWIWTPISRVLHKFHWPRREVKVSSVTDSRRSELFRRSRFANIYRRPTKIDSRRFYVE